MGLLDSIVYAIRDLARRMLAEHESNSPELPLTLLTSLFDQANAIANKGQSREAAATTQRYSVTTRIMPARTVFGEAVTRR